VKVRGGKEGGREGRKEGGRESLGGEAGEEKSRSITAYTITKNST